MSKLKLEPLGEDKSIKITLVLPASLHRDLVAYGEALGAETGTSALGPATLVVPMLTRIMASDLAFAK